MRFRAVAGIGLIGSLVAGWFPTPPAWAAGGLSLGPFEVTPSLFLAQGFEDNVCRTESGNCFSDEDEVQDGSDTVTLIHPGLSVVLPLRSHSVSARYQGRFARYATLDSENYGDQSVDGAVELVFPVGFSLRVADVYEDAHDARGFSQNTELDLFKRNTATALVSQELGGKLVLSADYSNFMIDYDADRNDFRDRLEQAVGGTVSFHVRPKTSLLAEYRRTVVTYDSEIETAARDNRVDVLFGGVTYRLTAKSKGTVKAGLEQKKFDDSERDNYSGLGVSISLDHEWSSKTLLSLMISRQSRESNLGGDPGEKGQDYYVAAGGAASVHYRFSPKISGLGQLSYGRDDYPEDQDTVAGSDSRVDNTFRVGVEADYQILKWLNAAGRFDYTSRTSTFDEFNYTNSLYSVILGVIL